MIETRNNIYNNCKSRFKGVQMPDNGMNVIVVMTPLNSIYTVIFQ